MNKNLITPVYSIWPILLATGVLLIAIGIVFTLIISVLGILLLLTSIIGWTWENRAEKEESENE